MLATTPRSAEDPFQGRRVFSYEEANGLIPQLQLLLPRIQAGYTRLQDELAGRGLEVATADLLLAVQDDPGVRRMVEEIAEEIRTLETLGLIFQGPELGLVDFPSYLDGEPVLLCWQYGEAQIEWFHTLDGGFAGRQRLPNLARPLRYD